MGEEKRSEILKRGKKNQGEKKRGKGKQRRKKGEMREK